MADEGFKRKLTAILSADVIGYSRLMRDDEEATVRDLTAHRVLITEIIQQHNGRVVDSPGDNILAEFASVVDAVNCAIKIQEEIKKSNTDTPKDRRMEFRIGINLGDVIEEDERIYGDGVNIAARVEGLAAGGGIAISGTVYEHIKEKLSLGYHYLGEQEVKNISEPVRVYRLLTEPDDAGKIIGEEKSKSKKWLWAASGAIALIILVVGAFAFWNYYLRPEFEPASIEKMAYPLPDKPSIAVLPFVNMSEDPKQEYFSDGLTDEIIATLSEVPRLFVIARNSTFTYKGKPVKVQQVSEELGVRYVLEGGVRKAGEKIRVTAQLIDALTGHHLWAEQYDRNLDDIFAVQDEITKNIIVAMQVKLTEGEGVRVAAKGTNNLQAYLKYLQAKELVYKQNPEDNALAKKLAEEAVALDPEYASAYYIQSNSHILDVWLGTSKSPKASMAKAMQLLQKAIVLNDAYADAHTLLGWLFSMIGQHDKALAEGEKAMALNPNSAESHMRYGKILTQAGKYHESIPELETAIRLNPIPPTIYLYSLGIPYCLTGQYEQAITWCERAVREEPNALFARLFMAWIYSLSGRDEKARIEAAEVLRIHPKFSLDKFAKSCALKEKIQCERMVSALRKAGLPE